MGNSCCQFGRALPPSGSLDLAHRLLKRRNKLLQAKTKCLTDGAELDHVNASLAPLTLADEGLRLSDLLCKFRLSEARILACLFQDL